MPSAMADVNGRVWQVFWGMRDIDDALRTFRVFESIVASLESMDLEPDILEREIGNHALLVI